MSDQFVVHRLRSQPVEYTITIKHFVSGGEWTMSVTVKGVDDGPTSKSRVASDLRRAAEMLDANA